MADEIKVKVPTKMYYISTCDACSHVQVCTLTKDYNEQLESVKELGLEQYVQVTVKCEYFQSNTRTRTL